MSRGCLKSCRVERGCLKPARASRAALEIFDAKSALEIDFDGGNRLPGIDLLRSMMNLPLSQNPK